MTSFLILNDLSISKELDRESLIEVLGCGNHLEKIGCYNKWVFKRIVGKVFKLTRSHQFRKLRMERWDYHKVTQYNYYRQC